MDKHEIWLEFCIWNFEDISHDEISQILNLQPTKIFIKGMPKRSVPKSPVWNTNCWRFQISKDVLMPFEDQMALMLDVIEKRKEAFKMVCDKYDCELALGVYIYTNTDESTPSIHFDKRYLQVMEGLNVEFDIDLILLEGEEQ